MHFAYLVKQVNIDLVSDLFVFLWALHTAFIFYHRLIYETFVRNEGYNNTYAFVKFEVQVLSESVSLIRNFSLTLLMK